MLKNCKLPYLIFLFIVCVETSSAQDLFPAKNMGFSVKGAFLIEEPAYAGIEFFHEWRLLEFLGLEVGGGIESSDNLPGMKMQPNYSHNIDYSYLEGNAKYVNGKITGYLPILYNDKDYIDLQLYGTFFTGVASLRLSGEVKLADFDEPIINKADDRGHLFYGFDFGAVVAFSEKWAMRAFIGGNSINFSKTTDIINDQLANRPFEYQNIENEPYWGFGLVYQYQKREK